MLTTNQIRASTNIMILLNTVTDCLRFVTEFFDLISKSAPHIYHSALLLTPQSSIIWKLYGQHVYSPMAKIVAGIPISWDSCTASIAGINDNAVWSPCGQLITTVYWDKIQIWSSITLENISTLTHPSDLSDPFLKSLTFSPDGNLLACSFGHEW